MRTPSAPFVKLSRKNPEAKRAKKHKAPNKARRTAAEIERDQTMFGFCVPDDFRLRCLPRCFATYAVLHGNNSTAAPTRAPCFAAGAGRGTADQQLHSCGLALAARAKDTSAKRFIWLAVTAASRPGIPAIELTEFRSLALKATAGGAALCLLHVCRHVHGYGSVCSWLAAHQEGLSRINLKTTGNLF